MDKMIFDRLAEWHPGMGSFGLVAVISVAVLIWYLREDKPYRGFRIIGQERGEWSYEKARLRFNTNAMELLRDGFQTVYCGLVYVSLSTAIH